MLTFGQGGPIILTSTEKLITLFVTEMRMYNYEFELQCIIEELNEAEETAEEFYDNDAKRLDRYLADSDIWTREYNG